MYKDRTVFVVGAGASAEFGFPVGWQLRDIIKANCDFGINRFGTREKGDDDLFREAIRNEKEFDFEADWRRKRLRAANIIVNSIESAGSIDELIFRHNDDAHVADVGKLAIAQAISKAEATSLLSETKGFPTNFTGTYDTWLWGFFRGLVSGVPRSEMRNIGRNITLIVFNYDRCIEHYLEHALMKNISNMSPEEAREIVNGITILHPYGSLGELDYFSFGRTDNFALMAPNLITWSESIQRPDIIDQMHRGLEFASQIVFLGFGFASQNMRLLDASPKDIRALFPDVYCSALGIRKQVQPTHGRRIASLITKGPAEMFFSNIVFEDNTTCHDFFEIHRPNFVQ